MLWQHIMYLCALFLVQGGKWTLHHKQRTQIHDMLPLHLL